MHQKRVKLGQTPCILKNQWLRYHNHLSGVYRVHLRKSFSSVISRRERSVYRKSVDKFSVNWQVTPRRGSCHDETVEKHFQHFAAAADLSLYSCFLIFGIIALSSAPVDSFQVDRWQQINVFKSKWDICGQNSRKKSIDYGGFLLQSSKWFIKSPGIT